MFQFRRIGSLIPIWIFLILACDPAKDAAGPGPDLAPALDTSGAALYHAWIHDSSAQFSTSDTSFVGGLFTVHIHTVLTISPRSSDFLRIVDTVSKHRVYHPILKEEIQVEKSSRDTLKMFRGPMTLAGDTLKIHAEGTTPLTQGASGIDATVHAWKIQFGDGYLGLRLEWPDGHGEWYRMDPDHRTFADTSCTSSYTYCPAYAPPAFRGDTAANRIPRDSTELLGYWMYKGQIQMPAASTDTLNREYLVSVSKRIYLDRSECSWANQSDTVVVGEIGKDPATGIPVYGKTRIGRDMTGFSGSMSLRGDSLSLVKTAMDGEAGLVRTWKVALTEHGFGLVAIGEDGISELYIRRRF